MRGGREVVQGGEVRDGLNHKKHQKAGGYEGRSVSNVLWTAGTRVAYVAYVVNPPIGTRGGRRTTRRRSRISGRGGVKIFLVYRIYKSK